MKLNPNRLGLMQGVKSQGFKGGTKSLLEPWRAVGALDWAELGHCSALFRLLENCWDCASTTKGLISLSWSTELLGGWVLLGTEAMVDDTGRALLGNGTYWWYWYK